MDDNIIFGPVTDMLIGHFFFNRPKKHITMHKSIMVNGPGQRPIRMYTPDIWINDEEGLIIDSIYIKNKIIYVEIIIRFK